MTSTAIWDAEVQEFRASVRQFVDNECNEWLALAWDQRCEYPQHVFDHVAQLGWYGVGLSEEEGGSGGSALDLIVLSEELGRGSTDLVAAFSLTASGLRMLVKHGTIEQKAELVPKIMKGDVRLSVAVTEPHSGSDAASLSVSAKPSGDCFIVNGQKTFCEAVGAPNTLVQLYARTDATAPKHKGISMLLLDPTSPGVTISRLPTLGRNITGVYEIFLDDVLIPRGSLVGSENGAWPMLAEELPIERLIISAGFVGAATQVLDDALRHIKEREQFGRPVGNFQAIAHLIVDLYTRVEAARLLVYHGAELHDRGLPYEKQAAMAKIMSAELYADATRYSMQMMGGYGYVTEHPLTMHYADSVIAAVAGGTSQVQRNIVARCLGLRPS